MSDGTGIDHLFTPGPWEVEPDYRAGMSWNRHIVYGDGENRICFMAHSGGKRPGQDKANAYLIAAAPELFEAVSRAADLCVGLRFEFPHNQDIAEIGDQCRAALAKARGQ